jgi:hypothetical protein
LTTSKQDYLKKNLLPSGLIEDIAYFFKPLEIKYLNLSAVELNKVV